MTILTMALIWVAIHFCSYLILFRFVAFLNQEKGFILFHLLSWLVLLVTLSTLGILEGASGLLTPAVAALSLHGVYSMTFWELWGSSEGGFSLRIMDEVEKGMTTEAQLLEHFERLGRSKRGSRLQDMESVGLVRRVGDLYRVQGVGILVVAIIRLLRLLGNVRGSG